MRLSDFVKAERLVVPLEATTLAAAAGMLLERLAAAGVVSDRARLASRVSEERAEDIVGMGNRAFLLHYRTDAVQELAVAIGTARAPICRELTPEESQCARILLMVVAPPRLAARYLQVVGAFARFLSRAERVDALLAQVTPEALAAIPELAEYEVPTQLTVRDLMTTTPRRVTAETALREAALSMVRAGVGGLPVVDGEGLVIGMLGERDLLRHLLTKYLQGASKGDAIASGEPPAAGAPAGSPTVRDVMTRQVLCVSPEQPLAEVASIMINKDVDRVPVVREGRLVGFLTRGDIVRKLIGSG